MQLTGRASSGGILTAVMATAVGFAVARIAISPTVPLVTMGFAAAGLTVAVVALSGRSPSLYLFAVAASIVVALALSASNNADLQRLSVALTATTALVPLATLLMRGERPRTPIRRFLIYGAVVVVNVAIALAFHTPLSAWSRRAFVAAAFPAFVVGAATLRPSQARRLFLGVSVLLALIALYYLTLYSPTVSYDALRSEYKDATFNITGGTYAGAAIVSLSFPGMLRRTMDRYCWAAAFVVGVAAVLLGFSRTFWATTPIALALTLAVARGARFTRRVILGVLAVIALATLVHGPGSGHVASLVRDRIEASNLSGTFRLEEATGLLRSMARDPATIPLGAGFGRNFSLVSTNPFAVGGVGVLERDYSHCWYLEVLWRTGAVGLSLLIIALISVIRTLVRAARVATGFSRTVTLGVFCLVSNFAIAAATYHPFGVLQWNLILGSLVGVGLACSYGNQQAGKIERAQAPKQRNAIDA